MRYEEMINGLAEEMLEKVASEEVEELEKEAGIAGMAGVVKSGAKRMGQLVTGSKAKGMKSGISRASNLMNKAEKAGDVSGFYKAQDLHGARTKGFRKEMAKVTGTRAGLALGAGAGAVHIKNKVQEKAANYFEEAEFLKQAAEEAYQEAVMMQDAAVSLYNQMED